MILQRFFTFVALCCTLLVHAENPFKISHAITDENIHINFAYNLEPLDALLKNSIRFSIDTPALEIVEWKNSTPAKTIYDTSHTTNTLGYTDSGTITVTLRPTKELPDDATLFIHFQQKSVDHPQDFGYNFVLKEKVSEPQTAIVPPAHAECASTGMSSQSSGIMGMLHSFTTWITNKVVNLKNFVSDVVEHTQSTPLRLVFVFLLGILMSLTPCIYPMIPITVGILQTTAGTSLTRNFLLAGCYTLGIAITFAMLGLLAAFGSAHFGALMGNVYFVLFLVAFLTYLALSMLGFYDMYVPRFMQSNGERSVNGSYASAFIFGVISGSVASPCLSPGLALLLSIVATIGNLFIGFIYLFFFGLGLGTPLLIIGTFSNSMNLAPRAGLWMVEVKKIFGLMLLSMCFYYLNAVMPWHLLLILMGATFVALGIWYVMTIEKYYGAGMRWYKQIMGIVLVVIGLILWYQAIKVVMAPTDEIAHLHYQTNYDTARKQAEAEKKLMLVDFGASWCSSCNEIEHKLLSNKHVIESLRDVIMVKIDCSNPSAESCAAVQEQFNIRGFPTILLVAPANHNVIARWGGELLDLSPEQFVELVLQQS